MKNVKFFCLRLIAVSLLITGFTLVAAGCGLFGGKQEKPAVGSQFSQQTSYSDTTDNEDGNTPDIPETTERDENVKMIKMKLYFPNKDNSAVLFEEREVEVKDSAVLKAAVLALLSGPEDKNLRKAIPEGTKLLGINKKENVAIVDFSKEYNNFGGSVAEIVARVSIVNTLTEFKGVEKVRILVEGKSLIGPSGEPFGDLTRVALDDKGFPISKEKKTITLYFANDNADKVVPEKREVEMAAGESLEKIIFEELAKGPTKKGLHSVIPEGTKLLSIKTEDGICTLDLSREFVDNHPGGTAGETMTINSIVNSLTELSHIKKVKFLIEGKANEVFIHVVFDQSFSRNESIIQK